MALPTPGDRAAETSTTTGTGTYSLGGAITGWQGIVAACGTGATVDYFVRDQAGGADFEVGRGVITDAGTDTLTRGTILSSSNAGAAVNWPAGTRDIVVTFTADAFNQMLADEHIGVTVQGYDVDTAKLDVAQSFTANQEFTRVTVGEGSGAAALTTNDGVGNCNLTFNHAEGIADFAGNVGRISVNTDATSSMTMTFSGLSNGTAGAVGAANLLTLSPTAVTTNVELVVKEYAETQYSLTGTVIDPANGTLQYKTLTVNTTFTESLVDGQSVTLMINDGTAYTATWPTTTWVGGAAPTLPTTGYAVIELWQINAVLYGMHSGDA